MPSQEQKDEYAKEQVIKDWSIQTIDSTKKSPDHEHRFDFSLYDDVLLKYCRCGLSYHLDKMYDAFNNFNGYRWVQVEEQ